MAQIPHYVTIDLETTGLSFKEDSILVLCAKLPSGEMQYLTPDNTPNFKYILTSMLKTWKLNGWLLNFQNGTFDVKFLREYLGVDINIDFDTMIAAYVLNDAPKKLSLDSLVSYYLGMPSWKEDMKDLWNDPELMEVYAKQDVEYTHQLLPILWQKLVDEDRLDFFFKLMKARNVLTEAEYRGMPFNVEACKELGGFKEAEVETFKAELTDMWPEKVNWRSPKQVLKVFQELKLDTVCPIKKKHSSGIEVIKKNAKKHPLVGKLLQYKKADKMLTSLNKYIDEYQKDGVIYCNFNVNNTVTGRLSSSKPNLQQVDRSKEVRSLFIPPKGKKLIVGDMAQIEVRMAAHYSKDPVLMEMFKSDTDFYGVIAARLLGAKGDANSVKSDFPELRQVAKVIGLSILYGVGASRLQRGINEVTPVPISVKEARDIILGYFNEFEGLKQLRMGVERTLKAKGYLTNLYGRKVDITPDKIYMNGVNSLLQSSASDMMLFKQLEIKEKVPEADLHMLVHDELIYSVNPELAEEAALKIKKIMEDDSGLNFRVPLKFDIGVGDDWSVK